MARYRAVKDAEPIPFTIICVNIPRKFLRKCLDAEDLTPQERSKINWKSKQIEMALIHLKHVQSVVERIEVRYQKTGY